MSTRNRHAARFHISCPEELEPRAMLAGHGGPGGPARALAAAAAFQAASHRAAVQFTAAGFTAAQSIARDQVLSALGSPCGGSEDSTVLTTTLTDEATGETATITARTQTYDDETQTKLTVKVTGAAASTSLDVTVNGEVVGQVTTDADGIGQVVLKDLAVAVEEGTTVGVGTLTGTLALASTTPGNDTVQHTRLRAELSDSETGAAATVKFKSFTRDDTTSSRLVVRVTGAAASSSLDVAIDGTVVGSVTTDENGSGKLVLTDLTTPVNESSTVTVGTMSGTLATVATYHGWRWHR